MQKHFSDVAIFSINKLHGNYTVDFNYDLLKVLDNKL